MEKVRKIRSKHTSRVVQLRRPLFAADNTLLCRQRRILFAFLSFGVLEQAQYALLRYADAERPLTEKREQRLPTGQIL